ncbi:MAG: hypothetical protein ACREU2_11245, partial [Steroidobacteraceae bacterium]
MLASVPFSIAPGVLWALPRLHWFAHEWIAYAWFAAFAALGAVAPGVTWICRRMGGPTAREHPFMDLPS